MRGKWAKGIVPTAFAWIIQDQIAVCERPGGFGTSHRRVRRQEEIIWIRENDFDTVVSLLASDHNLHNYDELDVAWVQLPFSGADDGLERLVGVFERFEEMTRDGRRIIVHRDELNDVVCGLMGAFLLWRGLVPTGPRAISITEQLLSRPLGNPGRRIVALVVEAATDPLS
ncbi:MAG: hypothetical protein QF896_03805 [Acidimicrobiales bacterium]|jgi:hypothetical protein|nr:hypothetical protein [Acidimicrobiales bacterium]|tara:strand:+ start:2772 stop:3284 length:513 start_codon:yes stop_codon:yes gene_type:complete